MQCDNAQELFSDHLTGQIDRALAVSLQNHLDACPHCTEDLTALRSVWTTLDEMPTVEMPPYFHENLMSRIAAETAQQEAAASARRAMWDWRSLFRPRSLALAATALIILIGGAEVIQTQRASLGPIGYVMQMIRPVAPTVLPVRVNKAFWTPQDGGRLHLELFSEPVEKPVLYKLMMPGQSTPAKTGILNLNGQMPLSFAMKDAPAGTLTMTLSSLDEKTVYAPITINVTTTP